MAPEMQGPRKPALTLHGLQYLRGIAALMVAYFHAAIQIPALGPVLSTQLGAVSALSSGVDIFFVISGFIMIWTTQQSTPGDFVVRRLIRIVPLYWLLTTLVALMVLWRPELFRTTTVDAGTYAKSLLFVPYANAAHGGDFVPILVPGWSLNLEMFFYAIFAMVLLLRGFERRLVASGVVFVLLVLLHYQWPAVQASGALAFLTSTKLLEFWLGMVVAHVYRKADAPGLRPVYWWLLCLAALVALTVRTSWFSPGDSLPENLCFTVLPAAVIVLAVVMLEKAQALPRIPALVRLGDASYSVYLSHILLLGIVRLVWSKAGLAGPSFAHALGFAGTSLVIVVAGSLVVYLLVEKPITARLQEQVRNCRRIAPAQAS